MVEQHGWQSMHWQLSMSAALRSLAEPANNILFFAGLEFRHILVEIMDSGGS